MTEPIREPGMPARRLKADPATAPIARPAITGRLPPLPLAAAPRTATLPAIAPRAAAPAPTTAPVAAGRVALLPPHEPLTGGCNIDGRGFVAGRKTTTPPMTTKVSL